MSSLTTLLGQCRNFLAGPCPACDTRAGAPMCASCRTASGIEGRPAATLLDDHVLHFVGTYRAAPEGRGLSPLGHSLRAFKDRGDRYAGRCLGDLFAAQLGRVLSRVDVLVPVPSDLARLRHRGLSSSAWLAGSLARRSGVALRTGVLLRVPGRPPQRGLGGLLRRSNARGAFAVGTGGVRGSSVALVDDVVTTGATLGEAAARLCDAGATSVVLLVLACADEQVIASCRRRTGHAGRSGIDPPPR